MGILIVIGVGTIIITIINRSQSSLNSNEVMSLQLPFQTEIIETDIIKNNKILFRTKNNNNENHILIYDLKTGKLEKRYDIQK